MKLKLRFYILILLFLSVTACTKTVNNSTSPSKEGGQDSGGGNTLGSTYGQVEYYFKDDEKLRQNLSEILNNLISTGDVVSFEETALVTHETRRYFSREYTSRLSADIISKLETALETYDKKRIEIQTQKLKERFEKEKSDSSNQIELTDEEIVKDDLERTKREQELMRQERDRYKKSLKADSSKPVNYQLLFYEPTETYGFDPFKISADLYIDQLKIKLDYTGACHDRYRNQKTGSVKNFTWDSTICLSINRLAKIPVESLKSQIHAILIHEISHTLGLYEDDAEAIQNFIINNYDDLLKTDNPNYTLKKSIIDKPKQISLVLNSIYENYNAQSMSNPLLYADGGPFFRDIETLELVNSETLSQIQTYLDVLKNQNAHDQVKFRISGLLYQLEGITEEIYSLVLLYKNLAEHRGQKGLDRVDFKFVHERLGFLSMRLGEIHRDLVRLDPLRNK